MTLIARKKIQDKEEETKFNPEFMAFVSDAHSIKLIDKACADIFPKVTILKGGVDDVIKVLMDYQAPRYMIVDLSNEEDPRHASEELFAVIADQPTTVLAIGRENEISLYRDLCDIGFCDYVLKPVSVQELHNTVEKSLKKKETSREPEKKFNNKVISFIGVRGGVGSSTLAVNLAWLAAEDMNNKTALIDFDVHFGTSALALDIQPSAGLRDALSAPDRLDPLLLGSAMIKATKNLHVLATEESPNEEIHIHEKAADKILSYARENHPLTVVDCPRYAVQIFRPVFLQSDEIYIVSELSLAGVRDTVRLIKLIRTIKPEAKIHCLVNRYQKDENQISEKDFERGVQQKIEYFIPVENKTVSKAANAGCAVSKISPQSKIVTTLKNLASNLVLQPQQQARKSWLLKLLGKE